MSDEIKLPDYCRECPLRTMKKARSWRYASDYRKVVEKASAIAAALGGPDAVTLHALYLAVMFLCRKELKQLTGKESLVFPAAEDPAPDAAAGGKRILYTAGVERLLSMQGGVMEKVFRFFDPEDEVSALHIAAALLWDCQGAVISFMNVNGLSTVPGENRKLLEDSLRREAAELELQRNTGNPEKTGKFCEKLSGVLRAGCFGQDRAIELVLSQLALFLSTSGTERKKRPLSFFFVGASGTGKNRMAELLEEFFASELKYEINPPIDFARHADEKMALDLVGRDSVWQGGGHEGILTKPASRNPRGIIRIDNFDHGHPTAISYLISALRDGVLRDEYTGKEVSFAENIIIIVTNRGNEFMESEEFMRLCEGSSENGIPRDKIIEGICSTFQNRNLSLSAEVPPSAMQAAFRSTLAAVSSPVLFRKHTAVSAARILKNELEETFARLKRIFHLEAELSPERMQTLIEVLLETQSSVESAHPLRPLVDADLFFPVQHSVIASRLPLNTEKTLRIVCEPLPALDGFSVKDPAGEWEKAVSERTEKRIAQAKRLDLHTSVAFSEAEGKPVFTLTIGGSKHIIMPSIEDAGFFTVRAPDVSFSDLVGADLVRNRIEDVLNYFKGTVRAHTPRPPTGILLYGPPGTGKTSVAKAVAKELGVPFISVTGSDFVTNDGIEKIKKVFSVSRKYRALVFIDEIDAFGRRGEGGITPLINALLAELDGFVERNQLVISATNRPDALDPALSRAGRLSLRIELGELKRPEDRRQLIRMTVDKFGGTIPEDLLEILVQTTGLWSPANLVELVNAGFRNAARKNEPLAKKHFMEARTTILMGEENQGYELTRKDIRDTAIHEAGHAIISLLHNRHFVQVTVLGRGNVAGFLEHRLDEVRFSTREDVESQIDISLAGRAAEIVAAVPTDGCVQDFHTATFRALHMILCGFTEKQSLIITDDKPEKLVEIHREEIDKILHQRLEYTVNLLREHRTFLEAAADRLTDVMPTMVEEDMIELRKEIEGDAGSQKR